MHRSVRKQLSIEIPYHNHKDVEFLYEVRQAHDHDQLAAIGAGIERAFKKRVEEEFVGQDITTKTRASITEFCWYLLSISKFFGYNLLAGGFVASIHKDMLSLKTPPKTGNGALLEATFTYFDEHGNYKLTANGFMRWDWSIAPDDPSSRRSQIMRDNNDTMPGYASEKELCERYHIYVEIQGQLPLLVLPV